MSIRDEEANRFSARASRYAKVGVNLGGVAARLVGERFSGQAGGDNGNAAALRLALGGLKGPLMKVAQFMATIPDLLPPQYAEELQKLQSSAPPMGAAFVRRRMRAELGPEWQNRFAQFDLQPSAAASLGQVHRATDHEGQKLACKLQYPDMASAVEADLAQLQILFAVHRRMDPAIQTQDMAREIAERIREELDYQREAKHAALYNYMLQDFTDVRVPQIDPALSTARLLTMHWLEGEKLLTFKSGSEEQRNLIARALFKAWWHPFSQFGIIHGDPHLGNYTIFTDGAEPQGINLLDYGCVRIFPPSFVGAVVDLYQGLSRKDEALIVHAYETWGFKGLNRDIIEILNIWAGFIYGPLLDDRTRTIADGIAPAAYGRREAFEVHQALKQKGPVRIPREFVFMDRAAIGLGAVFLHLNARLNFYRLFNEAMGADFSVGQVAQRQRQALDQAGL